MPSELSGEEDEEKEKGEEEEEPRGVSSHSGHA